MRKSLTMFNPLHHPIVFSAPERLSHPASLSAAQFAFGAFLISALRPRVLVSLNAASGDLFCGFCQTVSALHINTRCHGIILPTVAVNGERAEQVAELRAYHDARYAEFSQLEPSDFVAAAARFTDGAIDLLHCGAVEEPDLTVWLPKLSPRGLILRTSTTLPESGATANSCSPFWQELKQTRPHFALPITSDGDQIELLALGQIESPDLQALFASSPGEAAVISNFFRAIGQAHAAAHQSAQSAEDIANKFASLKDQVRLNEEAWRELQQQLMAITQSRGWQLLQGFWDLRRKLAPQGSARLRALRSAAQTAQTAVGKWRSLRGSTGTEREYAAWIASNEPDEAELSRQRDAARQFARQPLLSVITPVYNTPPRLLEEMIQSVVQQTYGNWQLCLADGNSTDADTKALLQSWAAKEPRIKLKTLPENLGISGNSNASLAMADGEFVALLDHDDLLAPWAFYEVVKRINEDPTADFIYSDRDMISEDGSVRFGPFFKPAWSPSLLLTANYLCHLVVIRKRIVDEVGGFNPAMDGAQDWDFFLRISEQTDRFSHIPQVLYHWRQWGNSSASSIAAKPYAIAAQKRAVKDHLFRLGIAAETVAPPGQFVRATWPVTGNAKVSLIIRHTQSQPGWLSGCLTSLLEKTSYRNVEILLATADATAETELAQMRQRAPDIALKAIRISAQASFAEANNAAAAAASGDVLLFLHSSIEILDEQWLVEMLRWLDYPGIGVVGAKLLTPEGLLKHGGVVIGTDGVPGYPYAGLAEGDFNLFGFTEWYRDWLAVTGDCLLTPKLLFEQCGGFAEQSAHSDIAYCLQVRAKERRVFYTPYAKLRYRAARLREFAGQSPVTIPAELTTLRPGDPFFNPQLLPGVGIPKLNRRTK